MICTCWHWTPLSQATRYCKASSRVCFCVLYRIYIHFLRFYPIREFELIKCVIGSSDTDYKHSVLSFPISFQSQWFIRCVLYVRLRNVGFCEKCGSKYYCHTFSVPRVLGIFSEEAVTLGQIVWKESFLTLYAFCHACFCLLPALFCNGDS